MHLVFEPPGSFRQSSTRGECKTWCSLCQPVSESSRSVVLSRHSVTQCTLIAPRGGIFLCGREYLPPRVE